MDEQCPEIRTVEGEDSLLRVRGWLPGHPHTADNERDVDIPASLVPGAAEIQISDFRAYLERVRPERDGDMLRIQTLGQYGVASDQDFYVRYVSGGPEPSPKEMSTWGARLDAERSANRRWRNLHVVDGPIGSYLQYQFEWAYQFNVAHGMDVRILDAAQIPAARALLRLGDFWVIEDRHVVLARYDREGRPLGNVEVDPSGQLGYMAVAAMAWELGTPFTTWWANNPRYHRQARVA